jgi:preprotein translocase subunit SecG
MVLNIIQLVLAVSLSAAILMQNRGTGLGLAFGGEGGNVYRTRRSLEKILFQASIFLGAAFLIVAFINSIS